MVARTKYTRYLQLFSKKNLWNEEVANELESSQIAKQKVWSQVRLTRAKFLRFGSKRANLAKNEVLARQAFVFCHNVRL